jgi:hypothetical protein
MKPRLEAKMQKHSRRSKHNLPLSLPVRWGMHDGSNANFLVDAKGIVFGSLYGIESFVTVAQARRSVRSARGVRIAEFVTHAINAHDDQSKALRRIAATTTAKRVRAIAREALASAGELDAGDGK